jgi:signal transduction histidine kinase
MVKPDKLLRLVTRLQNEPDPTTARRLLLHHIRQSSGAQLVALFTFNQQLQQLDLRGYSGRRPHSSQASQSPSKHINSKHIRINGLFGLALQEQRLLHIPCPHTDKRLLQEERCWIDTAGYLMLGAVRTCSREDCEQGVLVIGFVDQQEDQTSDQHHHNTEDESDIIICSLLLAAYLNTNQVPSRKTTPTPVFQRGQSPGKDQQNVQSDIFTVDEQKMLLERERNRIARDIHDSVAQHIAHVLHKLELIQRLLEREQYEQIGTEIQHAYEQIEVSLANLRHCISELRPPELEYRPLTQALDQLCKEYRTGYPEVTLHNHISLQKRLPPDLEALLFRFFQEALSNAYKHAQAKNIEMKMTLERRLLSVEVRDDGLGMASGTHLQELYNKREHLGLLAMRERVQEAGGDWKFQSRPGAGTRVKASFVLASPIATFTEREHDSLCFHNGETG